MIPPETPPNDFTNGSHTVTFSRAWLPVVIGTLLPIMENDYWWGTDAERERAADWAKELIDMLMGDAE